MENIFIIGCGASGIVSSIFAKKKNNRVVILERNSKPLKKLLITGNGKCNYLNESYKTSDYHSEDISIVDTIISPENIEAIKTFFDNLGVIPKIKNGYYYPFTNQAVTIKDALLNEAISKGVEIVYDTLVTNIIKDNDKFIIKTEDNEYTADKLVLATGSKAYPKTGSDGSGYNFLKDFNHTIIKPLPALVQLKSNLKYLKDIEKIRCNVQLELFEDNNYISEEEGEIQFTNYGISGICTFNLSQFVTRGLEDNKDYVVKINFVPFVNTLLTPWLDKYSKTCINKNIKELLEGFLHFKIVKMILQEAKIKEDTYYQNLSNEDKLKICNLLRHFKVKITGTNSYDEAQICNGGVKLTEINQNTMESNLVEGLYITGELLDINGNCGGYNLTNAWISGMLAGKHIGDEND